MKYESEYVAIVTFDRDYNFILKGYCEKIIRCRDCTKLNTTDCPCNWWPLDNGLNGFCAWGEEEEA